ncbi:MAG: hypothetical protein V4532_01705, partial [Pseudomonadota bacterium]
ALPDSRVRLFDRKAQLLNEVTGAPMPGVPYMAVTADGDKQFGVTDESGMTLVVSTVSAQSVQFHWGMSPNSREL